MTNGVFVDRKGQRFGRLQVLNREPAVRRYRTRWKCQCDCGAVVVVMSQSLTSGLTKSCGCLHREIVGKKGRNARHGLTDTPVHNAWLEMRKRCGDMSRQNYGGRGITICQRWSVFENFLADMGETPPGLTLERVDSNGNYEPSNCVWADRFTQSNNRRNNRMVMVGGEWLPIAAAASAIGVTENTVRKRIAAGFLPTRKRYEEIRHAA